MTIIKYKKPTKIDALKDIPKKLCSFLRSILYIYLLGKHFLFMEERDFPTDR